MLRFKALGSITRGKMKRWYPCPHLLIFIVIMCSAESSLFRKASGKEKFLLAQQVPSDSQSVKRKEPKEFPLFLMLNTGQGSF